MTCFTFISILQWNRVAALQLCSQPITVTLCELYFQHAAKITILAHSKQWGWLIKWQWWSGKCQSDNIRRLFSEFGVSGCTVCSVAECFQWLCWWISVCVCVWKHDFVPLSACIMYVSMCTSMFAYRVSGLPVQSRFGYVWECELALCGVVGFSC